MNYEIKITNMTSDDEMYDIECVLAEAGVAGEGVDGIGQYGRHGYPRSVFVNADQVREAVNALNAAGFTTDEDNTFKVTGWIKEVDLPGYNWIFTPDWNSMPDPPQEYLDSLEPHERVEYRVVDTLGRGSAGRVGRGKSFISAEENFGYERCEMVLEWV